MRRRSRPRSRSRSWISIALTVSLAIGLGLFVRPKGRLVEGDVQVIDGDSLRLEATPIRLKGLDAPELAQICMRGGRPYACGRTARDALQELVVSGPVTCRVTGRDRYQRSLARCQVGGSDIGARLVSTGIAVAYGEYEREEAQARGRALGLWAGEFERPSSWRQSR